MSWLLAWTYVTGGPIRGGASAQRTGSGIHHRIAFGRPLS